MVQIHHPFLAPPINGDVERVKCVLNLGGWQSGWMRSPAKTLIVVNTVRRFKSSTTRYVGKSPDNHPKRVRKGAAFSWDMSWSEESQLSTLNRGGVKLERCQSGLLRRSWKPLKTNNLPWVQIPPFPLLLQLSLRGITGALHSWGEHECSEKLCKGIGNGYPLWTVSYAL